MKTILQACTAVVLSSVVTLAAAAADGLVAVKSPHSAQVTMDKLESVAKEKGLNIFARIDHAAGAAKIGKTLRPTAVLVFGNPQGGTPFMECGQSVGIDLPLKALVWQDEASQVWVGYNDPAWIAKRHGVESCAVVPNLQKALQGLTAAAVAP
jgi:uncharacterized protein (DUF302 family)